MNAVRALMLLGWLAGCSGTRWPQGVPVGCEQRCMHWHLHAARVVVIDEPGPERGRTCRCVASPAAAGPWLSLVAPDEAAAAADGPLTIPAE